MVRGLGVSVDKRPRQYSQLHRRFRFALFHLLSSICVAAFVGVLVFLLWYPPPFLVISGGGSLFILIMAVDVGLGPTLTAVAASTGKPIGELRRDLALIVVVQVAGLMYGLHTLALARPVLVSFEIDRFRVVTAADIDPESLQDAPKGMQISLGWDLRRSPPSSRLTSTSRCALSSSDSLESTCR